MNTLIKTIAAGILTTAMAVTTTAETYKFSPEIDLHTMLMFQVDHNGFSTSIGFFTNFEGEINLDPENIENATVSTTIDMNSVSLAQSQVWHDSTTKYFLDAENNPTMTFASTSVKDLGDNKLAVTGDLTILGVTKSVVLDTRYKVGSNSRGKPLAGFSATTTIKRSEFGMDAFLDVVGDDIAITIEIEAPPVAEIEE